MFKLGDVVALKSGGPFMTVTDITANTGIVCVWFCEHTGQYNKQEFNVLSLRTVGALEFSGRESSSKVPGQHQS